MYRMYVIVCGGFKCIPHNIAVTWAFTGFSLRLFLSINKRLNTDWILYLEVVINHWQNNLKALNLCGGL